MNTRDLYMQPPELLVELVGGERDGDTFPAIVGRDGLPLEHLVVPLYDHRPAEWWHEPKDHPVTTQDRRVIYRRDRINDNTHRWTYRLAP